jgi:hypothetical protein
MSRAILLAEPSLQSTKTPSPCAPDSGKSSDSPGATANGVDPGNDHEPCWIAVKNHQYLFNFNTMLRDLLGLVHLLAGILGWDPKVISTCHNNSSVSHHVLILDYQILILSYYHESQYKM